MIRATFGENTIDIPIVNDTISASAFSKFVLDSTTPPGEKVPLRLYDSGFKNTTVCKSTISHVDPAGSLSYRGYDIADLVKNSNYLEVAYLLIYGTLPSTNQYKEWAHNVMTHTYLHAELEKQMGTFRYDAHPMGMTISSIASLSTFHPEANPALQGEGLYACPPADPVKTKRGIDARNKAIVRMLGKTSTIAANAYRHRLGRTYNHPKPGCLDYCENLLYMMDKLDEVDYVPDKRLVKILDGLFILLAEHGSNCSTVMMRHLASSGVDPYTALSGAAGALFGERKSSAVVEMLQKIGSVKNIPEFLETVKSSSSDRKEPLKRVSKVRLMGFGHRIYKTHDPRVKLCKELVFQLFELIGKDEIANVALELEKAALADSYFTERNLYPNIDYWMGLAFYTLSFPSDMFPVWMLLPRVAGLTAHMMESLDDPEYKIFRPRQIYIGEGLRPYSAMPPKSQSTQNIDYLRSNDPRAEVRRDNTAESNELDQLQKVLDELAISIGKLEEPRPSTPLTDFANRMSSWIRPKIDVRSPGAKLEDLKVQLAQLTLKHESLSHERGKSPLRDLKESGPDLMAGSKSPRVIAPKRL